MGSITKRAVNDCGKAFGGRGKRGGSYGSSFPTGFKALESPCLFPQLE